jgi:Holliday junction resolvasome RuvABC DNA-binding subunit
MTNGEAIGYGLMTLKSLGYSKKELDKFEAEMRYQMDMHSEEEADEVYRNN